MNISKIFYTILALVCLPFLAKAQEPYKPLNSEGILPPEFQEYSYEKIERNRKELTTSKEASYKEQLDFLRESQYSIDDLLQSGQVLYNDPTATYVNKVAAKVLENDAELAEKLTFYTIRSTVANAFATDQGLIFITTGLLSQLLNEAQLAMVLCHEITHFESKHGIHSYVNKVRALGRGRRVVSFDETIKQLSNYSKDLEIEADSSGYVRYAQTNYSKENLEAIFDVLHYSYLPYEDLEFDYGYLEKGFVSFPPSVKEFEITPIDVDNEDYDDSESSHPSTFRRKELMLGYLQDNTTDDGDLYLVSKEEFDNVVKLSRFENIRINLLNKRYARAIYECYLNDHFYPDNSFSEISLAYAYFGLHWADLSGEQKMVIGKPKKIEGNSSALVDLFRNLRDEQIATLATQHIWTVALKYPENKELQRMKTLILDQMVYAHKVEKDTYLRSKPEEKDTTTVDAFELAMDDLEKDSIPTIGKPLSKYDKIKQQKEKTETKTTEELQEDELEFHLLAFIDLFKNATFTAAFDEAIETAEAQRDNKLSSTDRQANYKASQRKKKKEAKKGKALGLKKVLVLNPYVYLIRKGDYKKEESEKKHEDFKSYLQEYASQNEIEIVFLDTKNLDDTETYNEVSILNAWIHDLESADDMDEEYISPESGEVQKILDKYGCETVCIPKVLFATYKRSVDWGGYEFYLFPISIPAALIPVRESIAFCNVYNQKGYVNEVFHYGKGKFSNNLMRGYAYSLVKQLAAEPKK